MDELAGLQHFHFLRPYWFVIFFVYLSIHLAFKSRDDSTAVWRAVMSKNILKHLTISGTNDHWLSPRNLSFVVMLILCLVLMGPTWRQQPSPFSEDKAALVIALDVSESMEQGDIPPSRLLRAKQKIIDLLEERGDANTALIAFSGSAHVVMPLSGDTQMIRLFLDALQPGIMPNTGKIPESSLTLVDALLSRSDLPGTVLLIGDGASEKSVEAFKNFFDEKPHKLIVWAMAYADPPSTENSPWTPAQLNALTSLAKAGSGQLVTMTNNKTDVSRVQRYIEQNLVIVDDGSRPWHDSGYPLIFALIPLFLFWFRRGWTLQW